LTHVIFVSSSSIIISVDFDLLLYLLFIPGFEGTDNRSMFAYGTYIGGGLEDQVIEIVHEETVDSIGRIPCPSFRLMCLTFSNDGTKLAAGTQEGPVIVWDVASTTMITELTHHLSVWTVQFSGDNNRMLASSGNDSVFITIWEVSSATILSQWSPTGYMCNPKVYFCNNDEQVVFFGRLSARDYSEEGVVFLYGQLGERIHDDVVDCQGSREIACIAMSPQEDMFAVALVCGEVRVVNMRERRLCCTLPKTETAKIVRMAIDCTGKSLIYSSAAGNLSVWDLVRESFEQVFYVGHFVKEIVMSADSKRFAVSRSVSGVQLFVNGSLPTAEAMELVRSSELGTCYTRYHAVEECGPICFSQLSGVILL
jgi:WD40 repeat protein